jgi:hypothetical protein
MYAWLWRHLPGRWPVKALTCVVLFAAVVLLLFTVVFPWAEPRLPFTDVTVDENGSHAAASTLVPGHAAQAVPSSSHVEGNGAHQ